MLRQEPPLPLAFRIWAYAFGLVLTPLIASLVFSIGSWSWQIITDAHWQWRNLHIDLITYTQVYTVMALLSGALNAIPMLFIVTISLRQRQQAAKFYITIFAVAGFFYCLVGSFGTFLTWPGLLALAAVSGGVSGVFYWLCVARYLPATAPEDANR